MEHRACSFGTITMAASRGFGWVWRWHVAYSKATPSERERPSEDICGVSVCLIVALKSVMMSSSISERECVCRIGRLLRVHVSGRFVARQQSVTCRRRCWNGTCAVVLSSQSPETGVEKLVVSCRGFEPRRVDIVVNVRRTLTFHPPLFSALPMPSSSRLCFVPYHIRVCLF